jgi:hypothetical protein
MTPSTTCPVYYGANTEPAGYLISDATGIARFNEPPASWGTQLTVRCNAAADLQVDLTDPGVFSPPDPPPLKVRPALTGDPASYSRAELLAGHYPPPPPSDSPMYDEWLKQVTKPGFIVQQAATAMFDRKYNGQQGYVSQNTWSGQILVQPKYGGTPYGYIYGEFYVPTVVPNQTYQQNYGSEWVGIGGVYASGGTNNENSMPQLGAYFDYNYSCIPFGGTEYCNWYTTYTAWSEYIPQDPYNMNLTVSGGDLLYVETYVCDYNGNFNMNGPYAYMYEYDYNNSESYDVYLGQTNQFYGDSAEAIVERPTFYVNGNKNDPYWYPLTDFTGGTFVYYYADDEYGNYHDNYTDDYYNAELCNNNPPNCNYDLADWWVPEEESIEWTWYHGQ